MLCAGPPTIKVCCTAAGVSIQCMAPAETFAFRLRRIPEYQVTARCDEAHQVEGPRGHCADSGLEPSQQPHRHWRGGLQIQGECLVLLVLPDLELSYVGLRYSWSLPSRASAIRPSIVFLGRCGTVWDTHCFPA